MSAMLTIAFDKLLAAVPAGAAETWGFRVGEKGTHTSRTVMLEDLTALLAGTSPDAPREDYETAVLRENRLGKRTSANRELSLQRLTELYGLDTGIPAFRIMRALWQGHPPSQPLLALLLALARDPLLRFTAAPVIETPDGHELARQPLKDAVREGTGDRLNEAILDKVIRNAAASWTQSGHLRGRSRKTRQKVQATPAAVTYALVLGHALGRRGQRLLETPWTAVLDASSEELMDLAVEGKRLGLLDLKHSAEVLDISFPQLRASLDREAAHGAH